MIRTSRQLKDLVRNLSKGDSTKAQIIIRNYVMQRFLERISLSPYKNNLILKGGVLVSDMVGLANRSTMDLDTTVRNIRLSVDRIQKIVADIVAINVDDGIEFKIKGNFPIMEEADYSGVRVLLEATLGTLRTPVQIDFSTGDAITPEATEYHLRLLFEDRTKSLLAYNLETVMAEKLQTVLSRGTANTRMRDFYDLSILAMNYTVDPIILHDAYANTSRTRGTTTQAADQNLILNEIEFHPVMSELWKSYQTKFDYASGLDWGTVMQQIRLLCAFIA